MKTEILSLVLLLSCTTASAAAVLPNSSGSSGFVLLDTKEVGPVKKLALPPVRRL